MIEKFKLDNLDEIMNIWLESNISAHSFIPSCYWEKMYDKVRTLIPKSDVYVYQNNNKILGFIGLTGDYISGIFVAEASRSSGIGKILIEHAKKSRDKLQLNVYEKNIKAVKFYERENFKVKSEALDEDTGEKDFFREWKK